MKKNKNTQPGIERRKLVLRTEIVREVKLVDLSAVVGGGVNTRDNSQSGMAECRGC